MSKGGQKFVPLKVPNRKRDPNEDDNQGFSLKNTNVIQPKNVRTNVKMAARDANQQKDFGRDDMGENTYEFDGVVNKQTVALDILKNGFSQSYVDFFYITSHTVPEVIEPSESYRQSMEKHRDKRKLYGEVEDELLDLKRYLIRAEGYMRRDKLQAVKEYSEIADMFYGKDISDFQASAYFYKRCVSLAKATNDAKWECLSLIGLGKCYAKLDRLDKAIQNHESILVKAQQNELRDIVVQVSTELVDIYSQMAAHYENKEDEESSNLALQYLENCLEAATKGNNMEKEGFICHKIGLLYLNKKDFKKALSFQLRDLQIAKEMLSDDTKKDKRTLIEAYAAISKTYINLGDIDQALENLNQYYKISKDAKKSNFQADAAFYLAKVWGMKGNSTKSIEFYQQHFDSAKNERQEKNRKLIDKARVYLGMAKANVNINNFIKNVGNTEQNIGKLLEWKFKKEK